MRAGRHLGQVISSGRCIQLQERDARMRKAQELIANIVSCEAELLPSDSTPLRKIKGWDSLKHVLLVVQLEKHLERELTAEEIQCVLTLADVAALLQQKRADA